MDGLEAVEIKHRKVALDNRDLRLDTEYFQKSVVGHSRMSRAVHLPCFLPHSVRLVSLNAKLKFRQTFDVDPLPGFGT